MNSMKRFLTILAVMLGVSGLAIATNIAVERYTVGPSDTQIYLLDDDGDVSNTGTTTSGGVISGAGLATPAATGITFSGTVITSSGTTTPGAANIIAIGNQNVLLISTGTGQGAWVKVGAQ